jgi:hypothetical protein
VKLNAFDRIVLAIALIFLGMIALRPLFTPEVARAQASSSHYFVEPGIHKLLSPDRTKQLHGKIFVDLSSGEIWGFPTAQDVPYPVDTVRPQPATSEPMYLGKFDFAGMHHSD